MVSNGIFVIAVGRRQENLDEFLTNHGKDKVAVENFDVTDLKGMKGFVDRYVCVLCSVCV